MAVIGVVVAAFACFVAHSQASQEVEEVDLRVRVLSEEEALAVIAQVDGESDDSRRIVAPVWVETGDDVVTWPFSGSVRMGLVEVGDNTCTWVGPAELEDTPKAEALAHAIAGLWSLSRGPFVKEATGVWRGRFGDGLAAARLFLPGFTAKCDVAGTQVVFTSTEDTFIVTGTDDHEALRVACDLARDDACAVKLVGSNVDVFTATPWLLKDGAWTPWETPPLVLQGALSALRQEVER